VGPSWSAGWDDWRPCGQLPDTIRSAVGAILQIHLGWMPRTANCSQSLEWFRKNLDTPTRFNRSKSKGFYRRRTRGIAWFKDSARQIKGVLEKYGHQIVVLSESRVGEVIHDDAFQVIAGPFSDTQTG
jgi:hypothetical protein